MPARMNQIHKKAVVLAVWWGLTALSYGFAGGTGEPNDPYRIATAEQLISIGSDANLLDKHFVLLNDIDLDPNLPGGRVFDQAVIAPAVRDIEPAFEGSFDGADFTLSNLTIEGSEYLGLFGLIGPHGTVKNLRVRAARVSRVRTGTWDTIGTLAGRSEGTIVDCHVTTNMSLGGYATWLHTYGGGLVGVNTGKLIGCSVQVERVGGLGSVGALAGGNSGVISACCASGSVSSGSYLGGLIGTNTGVVSSCYAHVDVKNPSFNLDLGGLVGCNLGTVVNCYSVGTILNESVENSLEGGLVGIWAGTVTDSSWDTDVSRVYVSRGGMGLTTTQMMDPNVYRLNGWAGDPNWVLDPGKDYPRLAWEGTPGQAIPEPTIDWFEGSGTEDDPYVISTAEQLARIGTAGILWDKSFILASDVNLAGIEWPRIGICHGTGFVGRFDGNGHIVSNLMIDMADALEVVAIGLFGYIDAEGLVQDLVLQDAVITCGWGAKQVGTLAGVNEGTIANCSSSGSISTGDYSDYVGQLVGYNSGSGTVRNCSSTATISVGAYGYHIGGLIGE